jgi:hypothetical protein
LKLAVIGNSHVAAMKRAVDTKPLPKGVELTFFGASSSATASALRLDGRRLTPEIEQAKASYRLTAGADHVELDAFDVYALVGLGLEYRHVLTLFRNHVRHRHSTLMPNSQVISEAFAEHYIGDAVAAAGGYALGRGIKEATGRPVLLVGAPCPSEEILATSPFMRFSAAVESDYPAILYDEYLARAVALADQAQLAFVPPNRRTMRYPGLTAAKYSVGSGEVGWTANTQGPRARGDHFHMNAEYGQVVVSDVVAAAQRAASAPQAA